MGDKENNESIPVQSVPKRVFTTPVVKLNRSIVKSQKSHVATQRKKLQASASFVYKQSLRSNNKNLAKALEDSKEEVALLSKKIIELTHEKSELEQMNGIYRQMADNSNDSIEQEIERRIQLRMEKLQRMVEQSSSHLQKSADIIRSAYDMCNAAAHSSAEQIVRDTLEASHYVTPDAARNPRSLKPLSIYQNASSVLPRVSVSSGMGHPVSNVPSTNPSVIPSVPWAEPVESETDSSSALNLNRLSDVFEAVEIERRKSSLLGLTDKSNNTSGCSNISGRSKKRASKCRTQAEPVAPPSPEAVPFERVEPLEEVDSIIETTNMVAPSNLTSHEEVSMELIEEPDMEQQSPILSPDQPELSPTTSNTTPHSPDKVRQMEIKCSRGQFKVTVSDRDGGATRSKRRKKSILQQIQKEEMNPPGVFDFRGTPPQKTVPTPTVDTSFSVFDLSADIPLLPMKDKRSNAATKLHNQQKALAAEILDQEKADKKRSQELQTENKQKGRSKARTERTKKSKNKVAGEEAKVDQEEAPVVEKGRSKARAGRPKKKKKDVDIEQEETDDKDVFEKPTRVGRSKNERPTLVETSQPEMPAPELPPQNEPEVRHTRRKRTTVLSGPVEPELSVSDSETLMLQEPDVQPTRRKRKTVLLKSVEPELSASDSETLTLQEPEIQPTRRKRTTVLLEPVEPEPSASDTETLAIQEPQVQPTTCKRLTVALNSIENELLSPDIKLLPVKKAKVPKQKSKRETAVLKSLEPELLSPDTETPTVKEPRARKQKIRRETVVLKPVKPEPSSPDIETLTLIEPKVQKHKIRRETVVLKSVKPELPTNPSECWEEETVDPFVTKDKVRRTIATGHDAPQPFTSNLTYYNEDEETDLSSNDPSEPEHISLSTISIKSINDNPDEKPEEDAEAIDLGSPTRRPRRAAANIDFKEPPLNSKLRRGDKHTSSLTKLDVYKAKTVDRKKNRKMKKSK